MRLLRIACLVVLAWTAGCNHSIQIAHKSPSVALAVRVVGGGSPTARQFANIHQALQDQVIRAGYRFAPNSDAADFVVMVNFTPDALDLNGGRVTITGVEPGPRNRASASSESETSAEAKD